MEHSQKIEAARPGAALSAIEADNFQKESIPLEDCSKSDFSGKAYNAFRVTLKSGIFLSDVIKRELKESCGCIWDTTYACYVGPIENAEIAQKILADRGNVTFMSRENLPRNDRERRIHRLLNSVDISQVNVIKEENAFLQDIAMEGYSESDFFETPSVEGKSAKKIEREKELYEKYQSIRCHNEEITNKRRTISELEEEKSAVSDDGFLIETGNTHLVADKGVEILSNPKFGVFQQQGRIVRIIEYQIATKKKNDTVKRANGAIAVDSCDEISLVDLLNRNHFWKRFDVRARECKLVDFPNKAAAMILSRKGKGLPFLTGFICCPTLREDGSLLESPKYDEESGLFFNPCGITFPKIPENPTLDQAKDALIVLLDLIKDFPFSDAVSRSVALAELMTGVIRRCLDTAPGFANDASTRSSGKTLLARIAALICTGKGPTMIAPVPDEEEMGKRFGAAFLAGDPIICVDNIDFIFESRDMCVIFTTPTYNPRILGRSKSPIVPTNALVIFTGNNLVFRGDICTRILKCRLSPKDEYPEERKFDRDIEEYVQKNRGKLVCAILTVIRAYIVAGFPSLESLPAFRNYSNWTKFIRGPLTWLGEKDPYESAKEIKENDPEKDEISTILEAWHKVIAQLPVESISLNHLLKIIMNVNRRDEIEGAQELFDALLNYVPDRKGGIDTTALGNKLRKFKDRIINGLCLTEAGKDRSKVVLWRVVTK